MLYKAFDGIAIEIYEGGELTRTHYVATLEEAHNYAKRMEKQKAKVKFATCDEYGNIIDRL